MGRALPVQAKIMTSRYVPDTTSQMSEFREKFEKVNYLLTNRKQRVPLNGEWSSVTSGIPQGSVIDTVLFFNLHKHICISSILMTQYMYKEFIYDR